MRHEDQLYLRSASPVRFTTLWVMLLLAELMLCPHGGSEVAEVELSLINMTTEYGGERCIQNLVEYHTVLLCICPA